MFSKFAAQRKTRARNNAIARKRRKCSSLPTMHFPSSSSTSLLFFSFDCASLTPNGADQSSTTSVLAPRTRDYPKLRNQLLWRSLVDRATSRILSLSRCGRSFALLVCPPCRWALTGLRAASRCRHLQVASWGCRAHESVDVESRYARVDPHFNRLSARPAADAARSQYLRKRLTNKKEQEQ